MTRLPAHPRPGAATILDLAIRRIDLARYLIGEIIEVCATIDHRVIPQAADWPQAWWETYAPGTWLSCGERTANALVSRLREAKTAGGWP